jgi:hypothetical protein
MTATGFRPAWNVWGVLKSGVFAAGALPTINKLRLAMWSAE